MHWKISANMWTSLVEYTGPDKWYRINNAKTEWNFIITKTSKLEELASKMEREKNEIFHLYCFTWQGLCFQHGLNVTGNQCNNFLEDHFLYSNNNNKEECTRIRAKFCAKSVWFMCYVVVPFHLFLQILTPFSFCLSVFSQLSIIFQNTFDGTAVHPSGFS